MPLNPETIVIAIALVAALGYLGYRYLPRKNKPASGCSNASCACPKPAEIKARKTNS